MTDMTDLTDVELDLAVARVMGRADVEWRDEVLNICQSIRNRSTGEHAAWIPWRPSQGGAAAWEVLEWTMSRYDEIWLAWADLNDQSAGRDCGITINQDRQVRGSGPTDAIALCRAVVALGEAGMSMLHPEELMTDYHELPEVPRCCLTCAHLGVLELRSVLNGYVGRHSACAKSGAPVNGHGLCSHWERRDG